MSARQPDRGAWKTRALVGAAALILIALCVGPWKVLGSYAQFIVASVAVAFIVVLAVNLLAGLCGIWSLGHSAYVAVGAYLAANLTLRQVPLEAIVVLSMLGAASLGFVLGLSAGRFSVLYFGLLTLALALVATEVASQWASVTGGDTGMSVERPISLLAGGKLESKNSVVLCILLALLAYLMADGVLKSRLGSRWLAVKGQRTASMAMGLKPHIENACAFAVSAAIASLAGVGMAFSIAFIDPVAFSLDSGVAMIVGTVVGGIGSIPGALIGAMFITAVPEIARDARAVSDFLYGGSLVVVLLFLGEGIVPATRRLWQRMRVRRARWGKETQATVPLHAEAVANVARRLLMPASHPLRIDQVSLRFSGLKVLDGISFQVSPGQTVGLIGPNGAGKTSLLNVLSGFYKSDASSSVRLGDVEVLPLAPDRRAGLGIGRTFQHAELFPELSIREMLMVAAGNGRALRKRHALALSDPREVADLILEGLGLHAYADARPEELPFGVQKVADVGRVLALGCSLVLMDEPFSGLDEAECAELRAVLHGMREAGASIVIIDHAVQEILSISDRVVVLDFGRMLAAGTPEEIRGDERVRKAYFGTLAAAGTQADADADAGAEAGA